MLGMMHGIAIKHKTEEALNDALIRAQYSLDRGEDTIIAGITVAMETTSMGISKANMSKMFMSVAESWGADGVYTQVYNSIGEPEDAVILVTVLSTELMDRFVWHETRTVANLHILHRQERPFQLDKEVWERVTNSDLHDSDKAAEMLTGAMGPIKLDVKPNE